MDQRSVSRTPGPDNSPWPPTWPLRVKSQECALHLPGCAPPFPQPVPHVNRKQRCLLLPASPTRAHKEHVIHDSYYLDPNKYCQMRRTVRSPSPAETVTLSQGSSDRTRVRQTDKREAGPGTEQHALLELPERKEQGVRRLIAKATTGIGGEQ